MMDLTGVIPQCIQPPESALQHQSLPHLPPTSSRPLPTIPTSTQPEQSLSPQYNNEQHQFSPHNQHHHFSSNNIENHPFYNTNQPFPSHNTQYCPFYDTQVPFSPSYPNVMTDPPIYHSNGNHQHNNTPPFSQRYPTPLYLPTIKELSAPSTPTYIPILTGRLDWCPWSEALTTAIMTMNLYGHIAEHYDSQWGFDPGSIPMYPPTIDQNSLPDELHMWNLWWTQDGQVLHLLVSCLSPTVHMQLPGAGSPLPRRHPARSVYQDLVRLFGGMHFNSAAVIQDELIALHCAPPHIGDYVSRWRSGLNRLTSAGHLFDHADSLRHFVKHLPFGSTFDIIRESVFLSLSITCTVEQLPLFESIVERVMNVELNHTYFQPSRSRHINSDTTPSNPLKDNPTTTPSSATTSTSQPSCQACSANFCTICQQTGHTNEEHKPGGNQDRGVTDWNKPSARAYTNSQ